METPTRILGRTERTVPPLLWELGAAAALEHASVADVLASVAAAGANWFLIPHTVATADIPRMAQQLAVLPSAHIVLGVAVGDLIARTRRADVARLDALAPLRCAALMVQAGTPSEMKSGGPFHRLNTLRQQGRCDFLFAEAETVADAEWMIDSSPAHAVVLPFGITDQTARFRVLASAQELGTAVIARRPREARWTTEAVGREGDVRFILAEPRVGMVVEGFPGSGEVASDILRAAAQPIGEAEREALWEGFRGAVKEPAKPRGNHPPEYGS